MNPPNSVRVDQDLLLEFFLTFVQTEFALKNTGFVKRGKDSASPNWDKFARSLKDIFKKNRTKELQKAVNYILANPPKKQILRNGNLVWETGLPNGNLSENEILFILVRRIRNNLFHGGKQNADTERTTQLLKNALLIIHEGLLLSPTVKAAYDQAAI